MGLAARVAQSGWSRISDEALTTAITVGEWDWRGFRNTQPGRIAPRWPEDSKWLHSGGVPPVTVV